MTSFLNNIIPVLYLLIGILISITLHEVAHGYAAYKLGDETAKMYGRLSLNPFAHINPVGFGLLIILMIINSIRGGTSGFLASMLSVFVCFTFAKPVPVGGRGLKNPRRDMAIISIAGPLTNFVLAFLAILIVRYVALLSAAPLFMTSKFWGSVVVVLIQFFLYFADLNIGLAIFNLVPIPPLDGSKILYAFLPNKALYTFVKYEKYISIVLIILLFLGVLSKPLNMIGNYIEEAFLWVAFKLPPYSI